MEAPVQMVTVVRKEFASVIPHSLGAALTGN